MVSQTNPHRQESTSLKTFPFSLKQNIPATHLNHHSNQTLKSLHVTSTTSHLSQSFLPTRLMLMLGSYEIQLQSLRCLHEVRRMPFHVNCTQTTNTTSSVQYQQFSAPTATGYGLKEPQNLAFPGSSNINTRIANTKSSLENPKPGHVPAATKLQVCCDFHTPLTHETQHMYSRDKTIAKGLCCPRKSCSTP